MRRGAGRSGPIPTSSITTSSTRAGTLRPGNSRSFWWMRCASGSSRCADPHEGDGGRHAPAVPLLPRQRIGVTITPVRTRPATDGSETMLTPITHNRRRVLGAAAVTLATGGLVLAGSAELRSSTPLQETSDVRAVLEGTPSRLRGLVRSIVHHLPGDSRRAAGGRPPALVRGGDRLAELGTR